MVYWFRRKEELNCFRYYALDKNDQAAEGIIRAPTFEQAYQILDKKFPSLIRVEPASPDEIPEEVVVAQFKRIYWKIPVLPEFFFSKKNQIWKGKIPQQISVFFARQMALILHAGLPFLQGLTLLEETSEPHLASILKEIKSGIKKGLSFSQCLHRHPNLFPQACTAMIESGEASGKLERSFLEIAELLENQLFIKRKITASLSYPATLVVVSVLLLSFLVNDVLPQGLKIYQRYKFKLPFLTRFLLFVIEILHSQSFHAIFFLCLAAAGVGIFFFSLYPSAKKVMDVCKLKVPILNDLALKIYTARTLFALSFLIDSGIPFVESCQLAGRTSGNIVFQERFNQVEKYLKDGEKMADSFKALGLFPRMILDLIATGETSGKISELLKKAAEYYETQIQYQLETLIRILEPCLLIGMSFIVLFIALAVFLPVFTLVQHM